MEDGIEQSSNFLLAAMLVCVVSSLLARWYARGWLRGRTEKFYTLMTLGCNAVGWPCRYVCTHNHFCMAGHFQHPPYSPLAYLNDLAWITSFVWTAIAIFSMGIKFRYVAAFFGINAILIAGTMVSMNFLFLFPAWLFCLAFAVACHWDWIE
jgi:hypothetical protein